MTSVQIWALGFAVRALLFRYIAILPGFYLANEDTREYPGCSSAGLKVVMAFHIGVQIAAKARLVSILVIQEHDWASQD